jgi:thioredoxin reductase (NADPH)
MQEKMYDIIIIGGGPAGLSAGLYAARARYKVVVVEKLGTGGQMMLTDHIDNYPGFPDGVSGFELQDRMLKQAQKFDLEVHSAGITGIERKKDTFYLTTEDNRQIAGKSVIIASGAKHRTLGIPGEGKFASKGVSYCGTCDGPFFRDKDVVVIGGGDTALTEALFIAKFAKSVKIVHRRNRFRAVKALVEECTQNEKIEFVFNSTVSEISGDERVNAVILKDVESGEEKTISTDGVFIFIGLLPNTDFVDKQLLDEENYIVTTQKMETQIPGMYAAGDVRSGAFRQIICAAADGAKSAQYAGEYIDELKGEAYK